MNWRGLHLSEAARLSVKQGQLLLDAVKRQIEQFRAFCMKFREDIPLPLFPEDERRG